MHTKEVANTNACTHLFQTATDLPKPTEILKPIVDETSAEMAAALSTGHPVDCSSVSHVHASFLQATRVSPPLFTPTRNETRRNTCGHLLGPCSSPTWSYDPALDQRRSPLPRHVDLVFHGFVQWWASTTTHHAVLTSSCARSVPSHSVLVASMLTVLRWHRSGSVTCFRWCSWELFVVT